MAILRLLLREAARRAANDPKVRDRAVDLAKGAGQDWREIAETQSPLSDPARFAGRMVGRMRRRFDKGEGS